MKGLKYATIALATLAVALGTASVGHTASNNTGAEIKCTAAVTKALTKMHQAILKNVGACRDADIAGEVTTCDPLPDDFQAKVDKAKAKVVKAASKKCQSICGTSANNGLKIPCINSLSCPPNGALPENCTGKGGKAPFDLTGRMDFPGPFCPAVLGGDMETSTDLGNCLTGIGEVVSDTVLDNIYGSVTGTLTEAPADCLTGLTKAAGKATAAIASAIGKCRDTQNGLAVATIDPNDCATSDADTAESIADALADFEEAVAESCPVAVLPSLDLCGEGVGGVATVEDAQTCLSDLVAEAAASDDAAGDRDFVVTNFINAVYPASAGAICGDNIVNQDPNPFALIGEECDGTDDSACPGGCYPPGDLWECTCDTVARGRRLADGLTADLDSGWTGQSHNLRVADRAGFISETQAGTCDCSAFTGATCTGTSGDPVCEMHGATQPTCSNNFGSGLSCDDQGDANGSDTDSDCYVCDENSTNPGDSCTSGNELICGSRCFDDLTGDPVDPEVLCDAQSDCAEGQTCRGRCDKSASCVYLPNGAPLPLSSAGVAVCVASDFLTDVTGTQNIVTGEHAVYYTLGSVTHYGLNQFSPCPVCGGFCEGGARDNIPCMGSCDVSGDPCRFDTDCTNPSDSACTSFDGTCSVSGDRCGLSSDCPDGETCEDDAGIDCPTSSLGVESYCNLDLLCSGGPNAGKVCRVEADTAFGTTSGDCPPFNPATPEPGLIVNFLPATSETVQHNALSACSNTQFSNFGCPCPPTGGEPTRPNTCAPACNNSAIPEFGQGCGTGNGAGVYTTCVGGSENGKACDANSDCDSNVCSGNPTHCTAGGSNKLQDTCTTSAYCDTEVCSGGDNDGELCNGINLGADCPGGSCVASPGGDGVCGDACPGGRCVPLCLESGRCQLGSNPNAKCATNGDCLGGGTCALDNPAEGYCAAGPAFSHCGPGFEFIPCQQSDVDAGDGAGCEAGVDNIHGNDDDVPGAGDCVNDVRSCFFVDGSGNHGVAEGGDIGNGDGDPTNFFSVAAYCIAKTESGSVNSVAGLGGPGRLRQAGVNVLNHTAFPIP